MKLLLIAIVAIAPFGAYGQTRPQPATAAAPAVTCEKFAQRLDQLDKNDADIFSEKFGDNSAPRATNRYLQNVNNNLERLILLQQMGGIGCAIPREPLTTGAKDYYDSALKCATARLKTQLVPDECTMGKWTRSPPS